MMILSQVMHRRFGAIEKLQFDQAICLLLKQCVHWFNTLFDLLGEQNES